MCLSHEYVENMQFGQSKLGVRRKHECVLYTRRYGSIGTSGTAWQKGLRIFLADDGKTIAIGQLEPSYPTKRTWGFRSRAKEYVHL